jgi:hypothetical protein
VQAPNRLLCGRKVSSGRYGQTYIGNREYYNGSASHPHLAAKAHACPRQLSIAFWSSTALTDDVTVLGRVRRGGGRGPGVVTTAVIKSIRLTLAGSNSPSGFIDNTSVDGPGSASAHYKNAEPKLVMLTGGACASSRPDAPPPPALRSVSATPSTTRLPTRSPTTPPRSPDPIRWL